MTYFHPHVRNYSYLSVSQRHFTVFAWLYGTETRTRETKSWRGGGECDQYLCWHLFPARLACLPCHQPSLQPGLFSCQLAWLSDALALPATSKEAETGHIRPASHITCLKSLRTHTHRFMCTNLHMKTDECTEIQKQTDRHAYSNKHTQCPQSAEACVWAVY